MEQLQVIQSKIYEIRGRKVMLDRDLAELYGIETKQLKRAVRRNIERFEGEDFMFELTNTEANSLINSQRCQFGTLKSGRSTSIKYTPFVFTELGVAMLSSVLNSKTAIEINRNIMRAFVAIRRLISNSPVDKYAALQEEIKKLKGYMEEVFSDYNDINEDTRLQLELINQALAELQIRNKEQEKRPRPRIGFIKYDEQ